VKKIRFHPNVPEEVRAIEQRAALNILAAIHRYVATGVGRVKPLKGEFEGLLRLRVGNHRVIFEETGDAITVRQLRSPPPLRTAPPYDTAERDAQLILLNTTAAYLTI
jgi:mRNA-degrading endonuclease RelE of RelBE toxin-antitoxin system